MKTVQLSGARRLARSVVCTRLPVRGRYHAGPPCVPPPPPPGAAAVTPPPPSPHLLPGRRAITPPPPPAGGGGTYQPPALANAQAVGPAHAGRRPDGPARPPDRDQRQPDAGVRVIARGAGVRASAITGAAGYARLSVRPRSSGVLTVRVVGSEAERQLHAEATEALRRAKTLEGALAVVRRLD